MHIEKLTNKKNKKINLTAPSSGISYINLIATGDLTSNCDMPQTIVATIAANNCNIINITITEFGKDFVLSALINGKWHAIIKLESILSKLTNKHAIHLYAKRNDSLETLRGVEPKNLSMDYLVQAITIDRPGILDKLMQFFKIENVHIKELTIRQANNAAHLINIEIKLKIPQFLPIVSLREKFLSYCEILNLDGSLEPA